MRLGEVREPQRGRWGKPLDGVRVLAVEQMQALPYGTQLLAHLGAEVVKVEHPRRGESGRMSRPTIADSEGRDVGATFLRTNLNKRSLGIDLSVPEGRELVRRLVPHFDVVAENFKAGAMQRMGLGYESLAELHPGLIYASISGFGNLRESPYGSWPAYAPIAEAMAGLYEPTRKQGEPPPVVVAGALGDNATAIFTVVGILAALVHRGRTGLGQYVDVSMYDSMLAMTDMVPFMWSINAPPGSATAGATGIVGAFEAADGYFVLAVFREHQLERLANTVGCPHWIGSPDFATREDWARQVEPSVRPAVERWAADKTKLEAARALSEQGVAAGPSNLAEDIAADPHVRDHNMLIEVPRPDGEPPLLVVGNPVKLSRMAEGPVSSFPNVGQHTDAVLRETLALDDAELAQLRKSGAI